MVAAGGELACLGAAALWAFTVAMFRRPIDRHGARAINLAKCLIATVLLGGTTWVLGYGPALRSAAGGDLRLIGISGLAGLTLGDTALFASVRALGPYRALLLQTLAPVFTAVLAAVFQGERLGAGRLLGVGVTALGVVLVVAKHSVPAATRRRGGVAFGLLAALGQASGIVLAKAGMESIPFLPASFLRMGIAAAGLVGIGIVDGRVVRCVRAMSDGDTLSRVVPAAFLGSYVGIALMMAGVAAAPAAVAAVLLSTTPVFSLFIDVARGQERLTVRNVCGTLLALGGVALLTVGDLQLF
jgi:drug/metabolite transporter (DMT)-like permease